MAANAATRMRQCVVSTAPRARSPAPTTRAITDDAPMPMPRTAAFSDITNGNVKAIAASSAVPTRPRYTASMSCAMVMVRKPMIMNADSLIMCRATEPSVNATLCERPRSGESVGESLLEWREMACSVVDRVLALCARQVHRARVRHFSIEEQRHDVGQLMAELGQHVERMRRTVVNVQFHRRTHFGQGCGTSRNSLPPARCRRHCRGSAASAESAGART